MPLMHHTFLGIFETLVPTQIVEFHPFLQTFLVFPYSKVCLAGENLKHWGVPKQCSQSIPNRETNGTSLETKTRPKR